MSFPVVVFHYGVSSFTKSLQLKKKGNKKEKNYIRKGKPPFSEIGML